MDVPAAKVFARPTKTRVAGLSRLAGPSARKAYWGLADQGLVSVGNFATGILLAKHLSASQYGIFAFLLEALLFLNSLQAALVNYPLTLRAASGDEATTRSAASISLLLTLLLAPALAAVLLLNSNGFIVGLYCAAAMIFWQLQETLRRTLIARMRIAESFIGDAISYLGQAGLIYALHCIGRLNLETAFATVAGTSALAMVIQAFQVGLGPISRRELAECVTEFWRLGRWFFVANLTGLITTLLVLWVLKKEHGAESMGIFAALILLLKITNPVGLGLAGVITPAVAVAHANGGHSASVAFKYTMLGTVLLFPYYLLLCIAPQTSLRIAYGAQSPYLAYAPLLWMLVLFFYLNYLMTVSSAWLAGLGESRINFIAQSVQMGLALAVVLPLTIHEGVRGMLIGGLISSAATDIVAFFFLFRISNSAHNEKKRLTCDQQSVRKSSPTSGSCSAILLDTI